MRSAHVGITPTGREQEQGSDRKGRVRGKDPLAKSYLEKYKGTKKHKPTPEQRLLSRQFAQELLNYHHYQKIKFLLCTRYQYSKGPALPMDIKCEQWYHNTEGIQAHKRSLVAFISISKHLDDI